MNSRSITINILYLVVALVVIMSVVADARAFRCDYCGKRIRGHYFESGGKNYHTKCYENNIAIKCALCARTINGEYYIDFWGNTVHAEHKDNTPQCEYCRRFISDRISRGGVEYEDGRVVCGVCRPNAIKDAVAAESIKSSLQSALAGMGINIDGEEVPMYLVNKNTMSELASGFHADPLGFTHYEKTSYAGGLIAERSFKIYMLTGLPRFEFIGSLAHELMHVWLFTNAATDIDPALREGSCNYAAYLILKQYSGKDAEFAVEKMMTDPDPVYGDGFRRIKKFVEKNGVSYWLKYLQNNKRFAR